MTDVRVFNLSSNRISLSTVGVVPRIKQLQRDAPNVSLALSLHAPTQDIREKIVPTAKVSSRYLDEEVSSFMTDDVPLYTEFRLMK